MITPAHCTRTDPHGPHETGAGRVTGARRCPGVEPPADVAATPVGLDPAMNAAWDRPAPTLGDRPDPRLNLVFRLLHIDYLGDADATEAAQRILDVLDDLAAAQTMHEPDEEIPGLAEWERALILERQRTPAPAGLSAAQEIRLRLAERYGYPPPMAALQQSAAWVEHGDDETPDLRKWAEPHDYAAGFATGRLVSQVEIAALVARADLAEARLGQVAEVVRRCFDDMTTVTRPDFDDALAWTPDDTVTDGPHGITLEQMRAAHDTATGDGDG